MPQQNQYDHAKQIGNQGDLIKHFALTAAVRKMAPCKDSFSYLDVHSGRRTHDCLLDTGKWRHGIGAFATRCHEDPSPTQELRYFLDIQSIQNIHDTREYWGSSKIVTNVLDEEGVKNQKMILCDTNPCVCGGLIFKDFQIKKARVIAHDTGFFVCGKCADRSCVSRLSRLFRSGLCRLCRFFVRGNSDGQSQAASSVEIHCADGYRIARDASRDQVDLIFIDPPDINDHYEPFMRLIRHCMEKGQPFISWNPLKGNGRGAIMSQNCQHIVTLAEEENIPYIAVRWEEWHTRMCGCQMLFSIPQGKEVSVACEELIGFMGWHKIDG